MADYYSLLARAVANLPKTSPPSTRRAIYDRARKALTNQLRSLKPQLPESDIAREERALDEAVSRLEAEFEPALADVHPMPMAASPAVAEYEEAPAPPPPPPAPAPAPAPPRREAPLLRPAVRPAAPGAPLKPLTPRPAPLSPAARTPTPPPGLAPSAPGLPSAAPFRGPLLGGAEPEASADDAPQPSLSPLAHDPGEDAAAPSVGMTAEREGREPARPTLNDMSRRRTPVWMLVGAAAVVGAACVAALALLWRPALQDLTPPAPVDTPAAASAAPEKTARRVGQAAPDPAAAPTTEASAAPPSPQPTESAAPPSPAPAPEPSPSPSAAPVPAPSSVAAPAPAPTPVAPPPAATSIPIAARAAMLVATVADAAKPQVSVGTVVWSIVPAPAGQPAAVGVKSEIDIPDLKLHASMILRKNFDASLPASHTIDLRLNFDPGSPIKGIKDIALPLMRRDDPPAADALTGVRVKISDNYFLVGLNRGDSDIARNVQELAERGWIDFPMQLDDDRIAKLTFEKGADGEKIVAQALAAWK